MKLLVVASMLLALTTYTASANPLYQWTGEDGTPTFSPDPPPKGVKYTIVGADLQPIQGQEVAPQAPAAAKLPASTPPANTDVDSQPAKLAGSVVLTPAPGEAVPQPTPKPVSKWKPVKYANDPNPDSRKPVFTTRTASTASVIAPIQRVSDECLRLKQQELILESQFAGARSPEDMDNAILSLSRFQKLNKGQCGY